MKRFACHEVKKNGINCTKKFGTQKSLRDHQRACHGELNFSAKSSSRDPKLAGDAPPQTTSVAMLPQMPQSVKQPEGFSSCDIGMAGESSQGQRFRCPLMSIVRENTQCPWECLSKMSLRQHTVLDHNVLLSKRGRQIALTGTKLQLAIATTYNRLLKKAVLEEKEEKRKATNHAKKMARSSLSLTNCLRRNATNHEPSESFVDETLPHMQPNCSYMGYQSQAYNSYETSIRETDGRFSARQLQILPDGRAEESEWNSAPSIGVSGIFDRRRPDDSVEQDFLVHLGRRCEPSAREKPVRKRKVAVKRDIEKKPPKMQNDVGDVRGRVSKRRKRSKKSKLAALDYNCQQKDIGESYCDTNKQIVRAFNPHSSGDQEECFIVIDDVDNGVENDEKIKPSVAEKQQQDPSVVTLHSDHAETVDGIVENLDDDRPASFGESDNVFGQLRMEQSFGSYPERDEFGCSKPTDGDERNKFYKLAGYCSDDADDEPNWKRKRRDSVPTRDGEFNKRRRSVSLSDDVSECLDTSQSSASISGHKRYTRAERRTPEIQELLRRRDKQIAYGKNTACYQNYLKTVPRDSRTLVHPSTPDRMINYSRRGWDMLVKIWRKQLHAWDPEQGSQT